MTANPATGLRLDGLPPLTPLTPSARPAPSNPPSKPPSRLSPLQPLAAEAELRILDLDIETVAAGYADPGWVPHTITAWAASWNDPDRVECRALPVRHFYDRKARRRFLGPLLKLISQADLLTGHNLFRFDLPVIQAEAMRLELPPLTPVRVQDTMRILKSKGFKKGQDNLVALLRTGEKKALNWQQWQDAYAEPSLATVKERNIGDVRDHIVLRTRMLGLGWLRRSVMWKP